MRQELLLELSFPSSLKTIPQGEASGRLHSSVRLSVRFFMARSPPTRPLGTYIFPAQGGFAVFTINVCDGVQSC